MEEIEIKNNNKYEIIKTSLDNYTLKYKDKEINFKSDVNITEKLQGGNKAGRLKLIADLKKDGLTVNDLVVEKKVNGKTYRDLSNRTFLEQGYINDAISKIFDGICKEKLGIGLSDLIMDIGLNENEIEIFSEELGNAMIGKTPR